jgi:hypothetical protein
MARTRCQLRQRFENSARICRSGYLCFGCEVQKFDAIQTPKIRVSLLVYQSVCGFSARPLVEGLGGHGNWNSRVSNERSVRLSAQHAALLTVVVSLDEDLVYLS